MNQLIVTPSPVARHQHLALDRRDIARVPSSFGLMYTGLEGTDVLIGDGMIVDLSQGGLGIRGNQSVMVGMELTLFVYLPDGDDPLFVMEARVVWVRVREFGVAFRQINVRERNRLLAFLVSHTTTQG